MLCISLQLKKRPHQEILKIYPGKWSVVSGKERDMIKFCKYSQIFIGI